MNKILLFVAMAVLMTALEYVAGNFPQGEQCAALGLFRREMEHKGNNLPQVFALLGTFGRILLFLSSPCRENRSPLAQQ